MKYITFVVPSYNSSAYMRNSIESLLPGGNDVEIIIVNDGSIDNTLQIAREYEENYPSIVKVIDKENGGHGSGVNAGIELASGLYFKVVDSDDWVDYDSYMELLRVVKENYHKGITIDCYFSNFVYENQEKQTQYELSMIREFPQNTLFSWNETKKFKTGKFIMMHSVMYLTEVLKKSKTKLLTHTFYVDNIYIYQPLPYCKSLYYLPVPFYRYFIGRVDQSINIDNMVKRYDQQLRVMDYISNLYTLDYLRSLPKRQYKFILHHLENLSFTTMLFIYANYDKEKKKAYKLYWNHFKETNYKLYRKIRWHSLVAVPFLLVMPLRKLAVVEGYKVVKRITNWG